MYRNKLKALCAVVMTAMIIPMTSYAATGSTTSKGTVKYDNNNDGTAEIVINSSDISELNSQLGGMTFSASGIQVTAKTADGTEIPIGSYVEGTEIPTAADILTGKSAWVNGIKIDGSMPQRNANNVILTSANNTQTFQAGFYPNDFKVSTNITAVKGKITYYHHQHSTTSTTATYTDNIANSVGTVSDSSTNPASYNNFSPCGSGYRSGCYTQPVYHYHTGSCYYSWSERVHDCDCHEESSGTDTDGIPGNETVTVCTCGDWYDRWHTDLRCPVSGGSGAIVAYSIPSSDLRSGTIVEADIDYR